MQKQDSFFTNESKGLQTVQRVVANFVGNTRYDSMEGKKYLVAPMIMIVEGVLNNYLYPGEELQKTPQVWNYKPVIVYHPESNGESISACDPIILTNRKVGVIMNTKYEDNKLKAEAWLEVDRMNKVDERISEAIENNKMMELSTGLFADSEGDEGEFNGKKYSAILRNYRPDHLALLPDLKGACSIEDGAGFLRLNAKQDKIKIINNVMSHSNIHSLLNSWLQESGDNWVVDVYDNFFIYENGLKLFKQNYSITDNVITVEGAAEEVTRVTEYRTKDGAFLGNKNNDNDRKEVKMNKKQMVDALIKSNTNSWTKEDRETLMAMDEAVLNKMQESEKLSSEIAVENAVENYKKAEAEKIEANEKKEEAEKLKANTPKETKPLTVDEYIANAPKEIQSVLKNGMLSHTAIKSKLVAHIVANEQNQFTKEELNVKDIPELQKMVALLSNEKEEVSVVNFDGQFEVPDITANKEEPMPMPSVVTAKS